MSMSGSKGTRPFQPTAVEAQLIREGEEAVAAHRHAALLAAGIHGGPHAWRWASDPTGTTLDDVAAWERLLGEMRERAASVAEWDAVLGRMPSAAGLAAGTTPAEFLERLTFAMDQMRHCDSTRCLSALCWLEDGEHPSHSMRKNFPNYVCSSCGAVAGTDKASGPCPAA